MPVNTNAWNRFRYTLYSPFYDWMVRIFSSQRRRSIQLLDPKPNEKVLLVGAGTGMDLEFLPRGLHIIATDLTPAMVQRIAKRATKLNLPVESKVMDGQALQFPDGTFDCVILHLIVAVIPDPYRCVCEAARVLKPGGRVIIFDKFQPDAESPPMLRRMANPIMNLIATNITRQLGPLLTAAGLKVEHEEPAGLGGLFKIVLARKS